MSHTAATPTVVFKPRIAGSDGRTTADGRFLVERMPGRAYRIKDRQTGDSLTKLTLREAREWIAARYEVEAREASASLAPRVEEALAASPNLRAIAARIGPELAFAAADGTCPRCGSLDVALWGETEARTENDVTDYAECQCGFYAESTDPEFLALKRGPVFRPQDDEAFVSSMAGHGSPETREEAEAWLRGAAAFVGPAFHPDQRGEDYGDLFNASEAMLFDDLLREVFTFPGLDPYAVVLPVVVSMLDRPLDPAHYTRPNLTGHYARPAFPDGAVDGCEEFAEETSSVAGLAWPVVWREAVEPEPLRVGMSVRLRRQVERAEGLVAPAGATGEVVHTEPGLVCVRLDPPWASAFVAWDGEVVWQDEDAEAREALEVLS